ncbi:hypothetical protein PR003_g21439 [Phytophthora rubi]|uniref:Uncharacterized protein n=1 Tax=Phytophthora rubi TaxID=129364 RepID=A0A6A4DE24_9STRA|nr:hypothetical protein PR001_g20377 [Phytophthora rubi]KAE9011497.1 hypothetical protein PR002_g15054 [Phytophthora rubi]KAE9305648.1 hypothetical protein PR003_g21439 [Phytophthora rubi]
MVPTERWLLLKVDLDENGLLQDPHASSYLPDWMLPVILPCDCCPASSRPAWMKRGAWSSTSTPESSYCLRTSVLSPLGSSRPLSDGLSGHSCDKCGAWHARMAECGSIPWPATKTCSRTENYANYEVLPTPTSYGVLFLLYPCKYYATGKWSMGVTGECIAVGGWPDKLRSASPGPSFSCAQPAPLADTVAPPARRAP